MVYIHELSSGQSMNHVFSGNDPGADAEVFDDENLHSQSKCVKAVCLESSIDLLLKEAKHNRSTN
jgi:hypothetical protein